MKCPRCETHIDKHEANRCLDAWVAEKVIGLSDVWICLEYSTNIAAACLVVEKMKNDWYNLEFMCGRYQAKFKTGARVIEYKYYEAQAATALLAICRAAIKASE